MSFFTFSDMFSHFYSFPSCLMKNSKFIPTIGYTPLPTCEKYWISNEVNNFEYSKW